MTFDDLAEMGWQPYDNGRYIDNWTWVKDFGQYRFCIYDMTGRFVVEDVSDGSDPGCGEVLGDFLLLEGAFNCLCENRPELLV